MASNIDTTKPTAGSAYTADVRGNFSHAKTEIEALQGHAANTTNPHGVTADQAGADPAGTAAGVITVHETNNDHTLLHTPVTAGVGISVAGQEVTNADPGSTAVFTHEAAADPHPQYITPTEGDAAYAPLMHVGTGGTAHADATTTVAGFMSVADKTKLDGVEALAEVNNISDVDATELTDGGLTTLHGHEHDGILYPASLTIGTPLEHNTLQEVIDHSWSAGVTHGGDITDNLDGTVSFAAATAVLRATADANAPLYNTAVPAQLNLALTDQAVNWVYLDYNAGTPQWVTSTTITAFNCLDKCIGYTIYRDGTALNIIDAREQNVDGNRKTRKLFLNLNRFHHAAGGTKLGANGLALTVTAGQFFFMMHDIPHDAFDTSVAGTANANVFKLWYRNGTGGWTGTVEQKTVSTATYDGNTGTPVPLSNNKFGVSWVYLAHDTPSQLHVVMGQVEYADAASAKVATPPGAVPGIIAEHGSLVGFVVYQKGAVAFTDVLSAFAVAFGSSSASNHNELAGLQGGVLGEYYHLTAAQATDLTDTGDSALHYHATDRDRANHTGTQAATTVTITDTGGYFTATDVEGALQELGAGWTATDADAIHDNVAGEIAALTLVTVDAADHILIEDASDANNKKRITASDLLAGAGGDITVDGGFANSTYLTTQNIDGGGANG